MDLEEFEVIDNGEIQDTVSFSASTALDLLNNFWYIPKSKHARWMDLLGDYAGTELFIMDGDALLQFVLDDPMLAIGRDECSFQILHVLLSLERVLNEFLQRSAEFEIVFWKANRHGTLRTGVSRSTVAALSLARTLLVVHLKSLNVPVHEFESLDDQQWLQYENEKKPMFVMTYDGENHRNGKRRRLSVEHVLIQRAFIFDLLRHGMAVTYLQTCEFRDAKISSHVYEQRVDPQAKQPFPGRFWKAVALARRDLDQRLERQESIAITVSPIEIPDWQHCLATLSLSFLSSSTLQDFFPELLFLFLLHCNILVEASVYERSRPLEHLDPELNRLIVDKFLPDLFLVMSKIVSSTSVFVDVDCRVFASLVWFVTNEPPKSIRDLVGHNVAACTVRIWSSVNGPQLDFQHFAARFPASAHSITKQLTTTKPVQILPFDNEVFNHELSAVHIRADVREGSDVLTATTYLDFGQGILFSDTQHWHNRRRAIVKGKVSKPVDPWLQRKLLRSDQRFMARMQRQAGTLTGALGASLQRAVILPASISSQQTAPKIKNISKKTKKTAKPDLTSTEKLRQEIAKKKQSESNETSMSWWKSQLVSLKKLAYSERLALLDAMNRNKKSQEESLYVEIRLYRIHVLLSAWAVEDGPDSTYVHDKYTLSIMRIVKEIIDQGTLSSVTFDILTTVLTTFGFMEYAKSLSAPKDVEPKHTLSFKFIKLVKSSGGSKQAIYPFMYIKEHPVEWQLRVFGEYMDRSMDSQPDPRVPFYPDEWQRRVLDCIDRDESLLVVAPTSAGKTFISYYAMEKTLRESDDGIIVYVAPTKALVNQIAAEVYARFSKDLNGRSCWSIHTRDYRIHDPQRCQILITVPEMLSIMLLSPPLARVWTPRIRRIILDEIHSIGLESGTVWENILLFAPCPIIGLSATIGQPELFNKWLEEVQITHGFKHHFISHPHRYSHLRKYFYSLLPGSMPRASFAGLDLHKSSERTIFLHPIAMLLFGPRSIPSDLALEAADTLTLYRALESCDEIPDFDADNLNPKNFFSGDRLLRQKDIVEYEQALKGVITSLMASSDLRDPDSPFAQVVGRLEDPRIAAIPPVQFNTQPTREEFRRNLIHLVADLHVTGDLPAILFNFNRTECEIVAKDLVKELQESEAIWRANNLAWKQKISQWEQWKRHAKDRERAAQRPKQKKRKDDLETTEAPGTGESSWESLFDPEDPSPQFSFASRNKTYSKRDLEEDFGWWKPEKWLIDGLRRGIAVHHGGMNKKYRGVVESLFRQGVIRVMISDVTLALGINAPTKTSVFCGDSPKLTALMYRQCAGRAGRRGFDLLGKVVFYGLAMDRVQRLILSRLPPLGGGNFPLTATMCLRLFNLLEGSEYSTFAVNAVQSITRLPQISVGSPVGRDQLLHLLRFSIDYLRRARLLDRQGRPLNLFGVASRLYDAEPSNFALVILLRKGVIHRICAQPSTELAKRELILLLAHLFGRRYLPHSYASDRNIELVIKKSPSKVILPPLPEDARKVLKEHDEEVLRVFSAYALAFAAQYEDELGRDCALPLSGKSFAGDPATEEEGKCSPFRRYLRDTAVRVVARSPFVANSGHGDAFGSVTELARTARAGVHLNEHAIPSLGHITASDRIVNAYLYDFFVHGQTKALSDANGIRSGDVWYALEEFMLTLKAIRESLVELLEKASRDADDSDDDEEEGADSGYGTFDQSDDEDEAPAFKRPPKVRDHDWKVYEVVEEVTKEFEEKFKAMWA